MRLDRWLRALISVFIFLLLSISLLSRAHASTSRPSASILPPSSFVSRLSSSHRSSSTIPATLLGWTNEGDAIIVSTPWGNTRIPVGDKAPAPRTPESRHESLSISGAALERLRESLGEAGWILGRPYPSPDGRWIVVERAPTGSETMRYSELWLADGQGRPIRRIAGDGAHAPRWSPDGRAIAYLRADTIWLYDLDRRSSRPLTYSPTRPLAHSLTRSPAHPLTRQPAYPPTHIPPTTIRVLHHPDNPCRARPAWAIDVIPFEEYVRRVVPAEVPASWPEAVLRAQAIAARTYAWYQVLQERPDFDVTDWTDFQVMCDATHPASDAAVTATQGQHIAYDGFPILAMYSADNGHPTVDGGLPYLRAVPDPVSLGSPRRGHGHGLSQWGAYRWVTRYGWDALQLLAHYYPGAEVYHAGDPPPVRIGLTSPWNGWFHTGSGVWLGVNATPPEAIRRVIFWADGRRVGEDADPSDGWGIALDFAGIGAEATLTVSAETAEGFIVDEKGLWLRVDRKPPQGAAILLPPTEPPPTITLGLHGTDTGPAGLQGMGLSAHWMWEGETFTGTPGGPIADPEASDGQAWWAEAQSGQSGMWTSPRVDTLPVGRIYRALFRLRTRAPLTSAVIARLEVTADAGTRLLGLGEVRGLDFLAPDRYQDIPVDFWYDTPSTDGLRFHVRFTGAADLALDRVLVVEYPRLQPPRGEWPLPDGVRAAQLTVVAFDEAGNASDPRPVDLSFAEMPGPGSWQDPGPTHWITDTSRASVHITVRTPGGFEPTGAACRVSGDQGLTWSAWISATADASAGAIEPVTLACRPPYPRQGDGLWVQFRAEDVHGRSDVSLPFTVRVDTQPPSISLAIEGALGDNGWYISPVTVTLDVTDTTSGLREVARRVGDGPWLEGMHPITVTTPGVTTIYIKASDHAGLEARKVFTLSIDMKPPLTRLLAPRRAIRPLISVHWQGADDASGIAGYDVQVREGDAAWRDWLVSTIKTTAQYAGQPQAEYQFRVRARDLAGRIGSWSPPARVQVTARLVFLPMIATAPLGAE